MIEQTYDYVQHLEYDLAQAKTPEERTKVHEKYQAEIDKDLAEDKV